MPGFDRTGPEGQGSQTGRKLGKCKPDNHNNGKAEEQLPRRRRGRGLGLGRGEGRGRGRGFGKFRL